MADEKTPPEQAPEEQESQSPPFQPYTRRPDPIDPPETISLLDLMGQDDDGDTTPTSPPVSSELPPLTASTSKPSTAPPAGDDTATVTSAPEPQQADTAKKPPRPLSAEELQPPAAIPPQFDPDATIVQPRVAFLGNQQAPPQAGSAAQPGTTQPQGTVSAATTQPRRAPQPARQQGPVREAPRGAQPPPPVTRAAPPTGRGCLRASAVVLISLIVLLLLSASGAAIGYSLVARGLPIPSELRERASDFETARIFDRNGQLLYAPADPNAGNRIYVPLAQISPYLIQATIATEDKRFYENPGFDPIGLTRAVIQAVTDQEEIAGTSTITQQLVRALLLDEEERTERTIRRKVREIFLAAEISRTYSKEEILELYLNEIYYGNLAYGIEAAAQTYFGKSAADLTLSEASLLAGLPQAPALWDPYTAPDKAVGRQSEVLGLMIDNSDITLAEGQAALDEMAARVYELQPPQATIRHPHFTLTVLQQAEALLGAQSIYRGGLSIQTTLDPATQQLAEETISAARPSINAGGANNAAMVVLRPETGEIVAMVGSVDFRDEAIGGQVNMALAPRQPGSTIKPLVYLSAFEQGWTPATLIWDVPTQFSDGANPPYEPKNYDDEFHGPLRLRPALGNSYNVPAVKALEFVGVCSFINNVQKLGLTSLQDPGCAEVGQPRNYGLSLALGGGEISPLELSGAFGALANQGRYITPYAIQRITNRQGETLYDQLPADPVASQVVRPEHAFLLSDILSDNNARQPEFGLNNSLVIPGFQVAAKTGTSGTNRFDVRDGWTIGFAPQVLATVWVGNTDNEVLGEGQSGSQLAAPIWNRFMSQYLAAQQPLGFVRPPGIIEREICADSGTEPGPNCVQRITELFAGDQPPLPASQDFLTTTAVDLWTGFKATAACSEAVYEATFVDLLVSGRAEVLDRERAAAQQWIEQTAAGQVWAAQRGIALPLRLPPTQECDANTPRPKAEITRPGRGSDVSGIVEIWGSVNGPNYGGYQVEYGLGENPGGWGLIQERRSEALQDGVLAVWDSASISYDGPVTIRVVVFGPDNPTTPEFDPVTAEGRTVVLVRQPTPTPTLTPTVTPTPTETPTATVTPSPSPTLPSTPTPTPTEEPTLPPEATPTSTPPVLPSETETPVTPYP